MNQIAEFKYILENFSEIFDKTYKKRLKNFPFNGRYKYYDPKLKGNKDEEPRRNNKKVDKKESIS